MKKIIIAVLCVVATCPAFAQTTVTSKALGDLITVPKAAFEIAPIVVTVKGDTARSMSWQANIVPRDTTIGFYVTFTTYDKRATQLATDTQFVPGNVFAKWAGFIGKIDAYILNQRKRLAKQ